MYRIFHRKPVVVVYIYICVYMYRCALQKADSYTTRQEREQSVRIPAIILICGGEKQWSR